MACLDLYHAPWFGPLLAASIRRQAGVMSGVHLAAFNLGLNPIPVDRRRHRDREIRLLAIVQGLIAAAELGLAAPQPGALRRDHSHLLRADAERGGAVRI
ncbi:hypothetical protein IE4872_PD01703 (plasmid) [Rhizobium gallicum]|uniref:DUF1612 domain-containing protein n=1 Tax=Rhizobium gallicum TaxID=56730 RepID=A0A1L5NWF9_9HYPH|nr:hypothetical protein IE4872_PD01703 [Rhizobium gallicum]